MLLEPGELVAGARDRPRAAGARAGAGLARDGGDPQVGAGAALAGAQERARRGRRAARTCARALEAQLDTLGLRAAASGTHPFAVWQEVRVSTGPRYQRVYDSMRELARREPTFALHVHVGVGSPDAAITCMNRMRGPPAPAARAVRQLAALAGARHRAWRRPAPRSSRRSPAWASRGRSATTPTGSRRWTCCCAARPSRSPPSSGGTCARSRASAPWRSGSSTCRAPWPRPMAIDGARAVHRPARARGGLHAARGAGPPGAARGEPLHRHPRRDGRPPARSGPRGARARAAPARSAARGLPAARRGARLPWRSWPSVRALADGTGAASPAGARARRRRAARAGGGAGRAVHVARRAGTRGRARAWREELPPRRAEPYAVRRRALAARSAASARLRGAGAAGPAGADLVDGDEPALEPAPGGAQVEAPDAHALGAGQP